ncbi:MAG: hypothetical protein OXI11_02750 [Gammaproteobacteria bacterium]|nr:hypothetical protein [Gammaproteobacteria bacterium]
MNETQRLARLVRRLIVAALWLFVGVPVLLWVVFFMGSCAAAV